jgi:hypothetical protein
MNHILECENDITQFWMSASHGRGYWMKYSVIANKVHYTNGAPLLTDKLIFGQRLHGQQIPL